MSLQGPRPELRGQRGGAAGNKARQAVPQPRTWKLPAASPQPGRFRESRVEVLQPSEPSRFQTSCFIDGKTKEGQGLAEGQMGGQWSSYRQDLDPPSLLMSLK